MTRRIALAVVLLTAAVLIAAVVPLALGAIAHERDAFVQDTAGTASSIALLARGPLQTGGHEDHADFVALSEAMQDAGRDSDQVVVLDHHGDRVPRLSHGSPPYSVYKRLLAEAGSQSSPDHRADQERGLRGGDRRRHREAGRRPDRNGRP